VDHFWHDNITSGSVRYIQTNMSSGWDKFEFTIYDQLNALHGRELQIQARPLIADRMRSPQAVAGGTVTLTLQDLDASELADITDSDPTYNVLLPPQYGTLQVASAAARNVVRRSYMDDDGADNEKQTPKRHVSNSQEGSTRKGGSGNKLAGIDQNTMSFTHSDIAAGRVSYKAIDTNSNLTREDTLTLLLTAPHAQPAAFTFHVVIVPPKNFRPPRTSSAPPSPTPIQETTPLVPSTTTKAAAGEARGAAYGRDHIMVVSVLVAITVIIIILFIAFKCCQRRRKMRRLKKFKEDSRTPLSNGGGAPPEEYRTLMSAPGVGSTLHHMSPVSSKSSGSGRADDLMHVPYSTVLAGDPTLPVQVIEYTAPPKAGSSSTVSMSPALKVTRATSNTAISLDGRQFVSGLQAVPDDAAEKTASMPMLPPSSVGGVSEVRYAGGKCRVTVLDAAAASSDLPPVSNTAPPRFHAIPEPSPSPPPPPLPPPPTDYSPSSPQPPLDKITAANWDTADPELLQHFRTSHPVLHSSKYWV
jgi:hypothetical protein